MEDKLKSRMNTTQFLGYTWNQKNSNLDFMAAR